MNDLFNSKLAEAENIEHACMALLSEVERRTFLKRAGRFGGAVLLGTYLGFLASCGREQAARVTRTAPVPSPPPSNAPAPLPGADLAVATGADPSEITRKALDALGGMGRFVSRGDVVVVKPNASFTGKPEEGTSTHPEVLSQVVSMCREAGASRVIVMDHCLRGTPQACLTGNGIGVAAQAAGAEIIAYAAHDSGHGMAAAIPEGLSMRQVNIYPEVLSADVVITVPKAKHHGSTGLSLGMKNFIGVTSNMSNIHNYDLNQAIADLNTLVKPKLSVVDATIVLLENGPGGPGKTAALNTVIASGDVVAADSYACTLFGVTAKQVPYIVHGGRAGLGEVDYNKLNIRRV